MRLFGYCSRLREETLFKNVYYATHTLSDKLILHSRSRRDIRLENFCLVRENKTRPPRCQA